MTAGFPTRFVVGVTVAATGGWAFALFWAMGHRSYDQWAVLALLPVLGLVSVPLYARAAAADGTPGILALLWLALPLKLLASGARYVVAFVVYGGQADSLAYHDAGIVIADGLRHGELAGAAGPVTGTRFLEVVTGGLYLVIGPTLIGGFVVCAWAALWGQWLFYRAYRIAFPDADAHRYAVLVLLWPSLLFWPSSLGKESLMLLALGGATYGAARLYSGRLGGLLPLAAGTALAAGLRPHMSLMIGVAVLAGVLVVRPRRRTTLTPMLRIGGLAVCVAAVAFLASHASDYFEGAGLDISSVNTVLEGAAHRTAVGGSEFIAQPVSSPLDLPRAAITVLLRPFPWEAGNLVSLISAAEGVLLMGLLALSWRRLARVPRLALRAPLVALSLVFLLEFVVGFSTFGNFGLLARERSQALPFLLLLACVPLVHVAPTVVGGRPGHGRGSQRARPVHLMRGASS